MDGMIVWVHEIGVGAKDETYSASGTINLASPTPTIAEISVGRFTYLYGPKMDVFGSFTQCVADGDNPPIPVGGQSVVIRSGLRSISYEMDVQNCFASCVINLFFWPHL